MTVNTVPEAVVLGRRRRWLILVICASALFLVGLDTTVVTVGLPEIGVGLRVDSGLAWVIDAYTVVFASLLMTSGALADRFGRRRVFRIGLLTFGASSLVCACAPSLGVLVAARAVQGIGASMLTPVALAIVVNAMPDPVERARAIGVWGAVFGVSMAAGPVTGGALIAVFDWRAVFWINVPIVLIALALVAAIVPESKAQQARRLDPAGQALLIVVLALAVGLLIEAPRVGWLAPAVIAGYVVLAVMVALFVVVESRMDAPLIAPGLFRSSGLSGAALGAIVVFVGFSMTLLMTTLLLQDVHGWSPLAAGAATLPMAVGASVCAPISGYLVGRVGPRPPLVLAAGFLTVGGLLLLALGPALNIALLLVGFLCVGIGVGFANAPITNTAVSGFAAERAGVASGITSTARQLGTAIGIALAASLVSGVAQDRFDSASAPGWIVVTCCGLALLATAASARGRS